MRRMSNLVLVICAFCALLDASCPAFAEASATQDVLATHKELVQIKLDANRELLQKDLELKNQRIDALERRIEDQAGRISDVGASVDRFGVIAGLLGLLVTTLIAVGGISGYFSVREKITRDAIHISEQWFSKHEGELKTEIDTLRKSVALQAAQSLEEMQAHIAVVRAAATETVDMQANLDRSLRSTSGDTRTRSTAVESLAEQLKKQPEASYSFEDWDTRAFASYAAKDYESALYFWGKASEIPNVGRERAARAALNKGAMLSQLMRSEVAIDAYSVLIAEYLAETDPAIRLHVAKAMLNKGVMLDGLKRVEEEIVVYDELISTYEADPSPALQEQVASAMLNKGVAFGKTKRSDEEVEIYDALIAKFDGNLVQPLRELVAMAIVNKGEALRKQKKLEAAIAVFDLVIAKYGSDSSIAMKVQMAKASSTKAAALGELSRFEESDAIYESLIVKLKAVSAPELREEVGSALNGQGFNALCSAKANWSAPNARTTLLKRARELFEQSAVYLPESAFVLANLAYLSWLQGDANMAQANFVAALNSKDGGRTIYEATLEDLAVYPVAQDLGYKSLIDGCWAQYPGDRS